MKKTTTPRTNTDLPDSEKDKKKLAPDEGTLDLPDAEEIPGQENIHPPKMSADTTISSDDEEGKGLWNDDNVDLADDTDVSGEERDLLKKAASSRDSRDEQNLRDATLENTDDEGEPLNEEVERSGKDLDVPGSEDDDDNEELGEEDEENNSYSLGGDR